MGDMSTDYVLIYSTLSVVADWRCRGHFSMMG